MADKPILKMDGIIKTFPGVRALKGVSFEVRKGEIHALMGENGAGKSTLIKILTGVYQKNGGTIYFDDNEVDFKTPIEAQQGGISTIYQEVSLIPYLTVTENVLLGREPKAKWGNIDWKKAHEEAKETLKSMGIDIDVKKAVSDYNTAIQQMVSIARAVSMKAKLVIMDEPTSSLDDNEVEVLFRVMRQLQSEGIAIVFVSHRLDEIYQMCDRITVLRDGDFIGTWDIEELNQQKLIAQMIGKSETEVKALSGMKQVNDKSNEDVVIKLEGVRRGKKVQDISFTLHRGEVLGLAGLLGSGRSEVAKVIAGIDGKDEGKLEFNGGEINLSSPKQAIQKGIAICTENRKTEGIVPNMSVRENITLACLPQISKFGFVSRKKQNEIVDLYIKKMGIKTPSPEQKIKNLSGGNQQKVLLARWLALHPTLLILDEPTRGIDVGAKSEIHSLIDQLSKDGLSLLMISSEFDELIQNTDRIIVLRDGVRVGELNGDERTQDNIMSVIANEGDNDEIEGVL
ncbi:sugar ABC transporter ATP-binding protein [Halalkalibacter alkaliphilus]|uniref:Sugar ABC transporter ATP-binding protein n=1 Tax=Halalkalibacter alkaliphilus TaxID=2917993 RepID=A0A9X1ZZ84_9BACI|nr:sugar ABC transporter ATP-binding protein [Halalkalibacter alkaliphilus]MCL7745765.1 sugar ABC transporter ATP-binding protein [Halalkalibacter alkaliphilus]